MIRSLLPALAQAHAAAPPDDRRAIRIAEWRGQPYRCLGRALFLAGAAAVSRTSPWSLEAIVRMADAADAWRGEERLESFPP